MSAKRALGKLAEWSPTQEVHGNSTAQILSHNIAWVSTIMSNLHDFGINWAADLVDEHLRGVALVDPVRWDFSPTAILVDNISDETLTFKQSTVTRYEWLSGTVTTFVSPEYELLKAIVDAPEEQRLECMRVLGIISRPDDDDYVDPGPDPQPVDFDWLASIQSGRKPS
jgi:hypothetical protein